LGSKVDNLERAGRSSEEVTTFGRSESGSRILQIIGKLPLGRVSAYKQHVELPINGKKKKKAESGRLCTQPPPWTNESTTDHIVQCIEKSKPLTRRRQQWRARPGWGGSCIRSGEFAKRGSTCRVRISSPLGKGQRGGEKL